MVKILKPSWSEGVLLSPQHFQQQAAWEDFAREQNSRLAAGHPWGVWHIAWDEGLLPLGKLKAAAIKARFTDGSIVDTAICDLLPPARDLEKLGAEGCDQFEILLGLPLLNAGGRNLRVPGQDSGTPRRYFGEYAQVDDLFGEGSEELLISRQTLHLIFDFEPHEDFLTMPIGRLRRGGQGGFELDRAHIPPALELLASQNLLDLVERLSDLLLAKSARLAERRGERNQSVADFSVSDVLLFWLLNTIHQNWPELAHLKAHPNQHPERLYTVLARLFGALSVFSTTVPLTDLPVYQHTRLAEVFERLEMLIRDLLDTVIPSQVVAIDLEKCKASQWRGRLHDQRLIENADLYLAVRADLPGHKIQEQIPLICKIGSPEEVEHIINSAVIGVPLKPLARVPSAIPIRLENQYFALEGTHPSFARMLAARECALYVPASIPNVALELFAVVRS